MVASAYTRSLSGASRISFTANTEGLGSYVPVLGLTNMVHTRDSSSSQSASPRSRLDHLRARGGARGRAVGRTVRFRGGIRRRRTRGRAFQSGRDSVPRKSRAGADRAGGDRVPGVRAPARGFAVVSRAYLRGGHLVTALPQHLERLGAGEQVVGVVHLHLELRTRREEGRFGDVSDAAGGERRVGGGRDARRGRLAGRDRGSRRVPGTCPPSIPPPSGALRPTPWRRAERHPLLGIRVSTRATSGGRPDRRCAGAVTTGSSRTSRPKQASERGRVVDRARSPGDVPTPRPRIEHPARFGRRNGNTREKSLLSRFRLGQNRVRLAPDDDRHGQTVSDFCECNHISR